MRAHTRAPILRNVDPDRSRQRQDKKNEPISSSQSMINVFISYYVLIFQVRNAINERD